MGFPPMQVAFLALTLSMGCQILLPAAFAGLWEAVSGVSLMDAAQRPESLTASEITAYKLMIVLTQTLGIGAVAFLFALGSGLAAQELRVKRKADWRLIPLASLAMIAALPFIQYTILPADSFSFPDALKPLEDALRDIEERNAAMIGRLLEGQFALNLLFVAVTPGLMEELLFRGTIQSSLMRRTSPHLAILVTGLLFSAIHLQVYGFVGRALLGVGFGYLCWWSGSLWPAVAAHFTNNAVSATLAYLNANQFADGKWAKPDAEVSLIAAALSLGATLSLMAWFRRLSSETPHSPSEP